MDYSVTSFSTTGYLLSQPEVPYLPDNTADYSADIKDLSEKNQALYRKLPQREANRIRESMRSMRAMGFSSDVINRTFEQSFRKFNIEVSQVRNGVASFDSHRQEVTNGLQATSKKISTLDFTFQPILPPQRDFNTYVYQDAINAYMNAKGMERLTQARESKPKREPNAFQKSMMDLHEDAVHLAVGMRVAAATIEGIEKGVSAAVTYGCNLNPTTKKVCEITLDFSEGVVEVAKEVVTAVGAKPMAQKVISVFTEEAKGMTYFLMEHGLSSEMAHQGEKDLRTVTSTAAVSAGMMGVLRLAKVFIPSRVAAPANKALTREKLLLSNNHEVKIQRASDPISGKQHPTFLLAPESTQSTPTKLLLGPKASAKLSSPSTKFITAPPPAYPALPKPQNPVFRAVNNEKAIAITRQATELPPGQTSIPPFIEVKALMESGTVPKYFGTKSLSPIESFIQNTIHEPYTITTVENPGSGNTLHTVWDAKGVPIGFVKEFIATRSPVSGFIPEIASNTLLRAKNLNNALLPDIGDIGMYRTEYGSEKGLVMYSHITGKKIGELFELNLPIPAKKIGRLFGEIGAVNSSLPVAEVYIKQKILEISVIAESVFFRLNKLEIPTAITLKHVEVISNAMKQNPGRAGIVHGDAYHNNIFYDQDNLTVIDTGTLMASVNRVGEPHGIPAFDQQEIVVSMYHLGARYGYSQEQVEKIIAEYFEGYRELIPVSLSESSETFARLYFEIMALNYLLTAQYDKKLVEIAVERVNRVFGEIDLGTVQKEMPLPELPAASSSISSNIARFMADEAGTLQLKKITDVATRTISRTFLPIRAPDVLKAFPEAVKVKSKANVKGGGVQRKRWADKKYIYEWDSRHGYVEKYNSRGKHKGKFDPVTGERMGEANPKKVITP